MEAHIWAMGRWGIQYLLSFPLLLQKLLRWVGASVSTIPSCHKRIKSAIWDCDNVIWGCGLGHNSRIAASFSSLDDRGWVYLVWPSNGPCAEALGRGPWNSPEGGVGGSTILDQGQVRGEATESLTLQLNRMAGGLMSQVTKNKGL